MFRCDFCGQDRDDVRVDLTDEQSLTLSSLVAASNPHRQICLDCVHQIMLNVARAIDLVRQAIVEVGETLVRCAQHPEVQRVIQKLERLEDQNKEERE